MIVTFKHKGLKKFFLEGDTTKINPQHTKKLRIILAQLHAAKEIKDLNFPGSNLHMLKGHLKDYWSVRVTGNWRIIFQYINGDAYDIDYVDYH